MPYAVAGGAIAAVGGIAGGLLQGSATSKAAAQAQKQFEQQRADLTPYRTAGLAPMQAQTDLLGLNGPDAASAAMANYQTSPGYQWQFNEGRRAVESGAAANEMTRSGAAMKALDVFGQGLANQDFGQYYNRLMALTTLGENAAAGGASTANAAGAAAQQAGNTQASIYGNTASGLVGTVNNLLSDKNFQNWVSPGSGGGGGYVDTTSTF